MIENNPSLLTDEKSRNIFQDFGSVVIRNWSDADIDGYAELVADPTAMKYIADGHPRARARAEAEVDRFRKEISTRGWSRFVIARRDDNKFAGYIGFQEVNGEIDYGGRFLQQFWRSRMIPLSYCLTLEYGFEKIGFDSLYATVHPENKNALSVTKAFFGINEKLVSGAFGQLVRFDLNREQYNQMLREPNRKFMSKAARVHAETNA
ncbi:GNAT family N-acetyltransferase [Ottowia thiooxydans]|uniref:RimJ/RimL family protein N-acetyltransferase n=1 Tax=Ottowia thiooxydans TaxID=219182 RepID=A0ABV2QH17_9BURK